MRADVNEAERVKRLVTNASALMGSQNKLAKALGYQSSDLSEWANGKRTCPVKAQALMAHMTGLDAAEVALYGLIESETNPQRKAALFEALGKGLAAASAAALFCTPANAALAFETGYSYLIRCVLC